MRAREGCNEGEEDVRMKSWKDVNMDLRSEKEGRGK